MYLNLAFLHSKFEIPWKYFFFAVSCLDGQIFPGFAMKHPIGSNVKHSPNVHEAKTPNIGTISMVHQTIDLLTCQFQAAQFVQ